MYIYTVTVLAAVVIGTVLAEDESLQETATKFALNLRVPEELKMLNSQRKGGSSRDERVLFKLHHPQHSQEKGNQKGGQYKLLFGVPKIVFTAGIAKKKKKHSGSKYKTTTAAPETTEAPAPSGAKGQWIFVKEAEPHHHQQQGWKQKQGWHNSDEDVICESKKARKKKAKKYKKYVKKKLHSVKKAMKKKGYVDKADTWSEEDFDDQFRFRGSTASSTSQYKWEAFKSSPKSKSYPRLEEIGPRQQVTKRNQKKEKKKINSPPILHRTLLLQPPEGPYHSRPNFRQISYPKRRSSSESIEDTISYSPHHSQMALRLKNRGSPSSRHQFFRHLPPLLSQYSLWLPHPHV